MIDCWWILSPKKKQIILWGKQIQKCIQRKKKDSSFLWHRKYFLLLIKKNSSRYCKLCLPCPQNAECIVFILGSHHYHYIVLTKVCIDYSNYTNSFHILLLLFCCTECNVVVADNRHKTLIKFQLRQWREWWDGGNNVISLQYAMIGLGKKKDRQHWWSILFAQQIQ